MKRMFFVVSVAFMKNQINESLNKEGSFGSGADELKVCYWITGAENSDRWPPRGLDWYTSRGRLTRRRRSLWREVLDWLNIVFMKDVAPICSCKWEWPLLIHFIGDNILSVPIFWFYVGFEGVMMPS